MQDKADPNNEIALILDGKVKRKIVKQTVFIIIEGYDKCLWSHFYWS
jgi:hypothetical protein